MPDWTAAGGALTGGASVDAALVPDALATATSQIATAPASQPAGLACGLNRLMLTSPRLHADPSRGGAIGCAEEATGVPGRKLVSP